MRKISTYQLRVDYAYLRTIAFSIESTIEERKRARDKMASLKRRIDARERHEALTSIGLSRVRSASGKVYYE